MIRDLAIDYPDFIIVASDWFIVVPGKELFEEKGDHADESETSVMLHYCPGLVDMKKRVMVLIHLSGLRCYGEV